MLLSRWRRIATGIAAGVIVLCAALVGASFRDTNTAVSVASEIRGATPIPIEVEPDDSEAQDGNEPAETEGDADSVTVIESDDLPATDDADDQVADATETPGAAESDDEAPATEDATGDTASEDAASDGDASDAAASDDTTSDSAASDDTASDDAATDDAADTPAAPTPEPTVAPTPAPLASGDDALGTGGGVDDAECALDRLVIYAGARVGGVAGQLRAALAQAGFAASCAAPVTVLASNCPLQFAGVLGAGSGYDPSRSYVASSASVDRDTMTAVMGTLGYTGNSIDILDFGFVNPDKPGEQWMAIFVPPSFAGWESLAGRAGLAPSTQSLCAPSGQLAG